MVRDVHALGKNQSNRLNKSIFIWFDFIIIKIYNVFERTLILVRQRVVGKQGLIFFS